MASTINYHTTHILTQDYVEDILKKHFKDSSLKVLDIETIPATEKGESYCSIMTKMIVNYKIDGVNKVKQLNCIAKSTYENESNSFKILQKYDVFNTEMEMYENVFPQLQQLLKEIDDSDELCARTIHVDYDRNIIILEDLSARKYVMANRFEGMDEMHVKICLRKLAKMHATAAVLNERQNGELEKYTHGIFNRHVNYFGIFFENTFGVCAEFAETCPELGPYYRDKLLKLIPHISEYATRCYDPKPQDFLTLNHGDMWTNNCMVQYNDEKRVGHILLIDFQYCNWTSPAVDLHYLFATSMEDDLVFNGQSKFIQYYHSILRDTLEKLKYKQHIPTLHELNVQLLERAFYAVTSSLTNFPIMINDKTEDADIDSLIGSDERSKRFHKLLYTNERVHRILKVMLPRFDQLGLLDIV